MPRTRPGWPRTGRVQLPPASQVVHDSPCRSPLHDVPAGDSPWSDGRTPRLATLPRRDKRYMRPGLPDFACLQPGVDPHDSSHRTGRRTGTASPRRMGTLLDVGSRRTTGRRESLLQHFCGRRCRARPDARPRAGTRTTGVDRSDRPREKILRPYDSCHNLSHRRLGLAAPDACPRDSPCTLRTGIPSSNFRIGDICCTPLRYVVRRARISCDHDSADSDPHFATKPSSGNCCNRAPAVPRGSPDGNRYSSGKRVH